MTKRSAETLRWRNRTRRNRTAYNKYMREYRRRPRLQRAACEQKSRWRKENNLWHRLYLKVWRRIRGQKCANCGYYRARVKPTLRMQQPFCEHC